MASSVPSNTAAYLVMEKSHPFQIKPAPLGQPAENQILIKNRAVAVNPIDGKLQALAFYPISYPTILGQDAAGEVISVGPGVTAFKPGDRVIGNTTGFETKQLAERAFQAYTVLDVALSCKIPDTMSFEQAAVLPLSVSTASAGLFNPDFLNLNLPSAAESTNKGDSLLVWGGASSVGSSAIQLAVAAGYDVVATASPKNFEYVRNLGASQVLDYNSPTVVADLVEVFSTTQGLVGAFDAVGGAAWIPVAEVVAKSTTAAASSARKFVATVTPRFPDPPQGVEMKQMYALSIRKNHVAKAIWGDFLPKALAERRFVPAPEPLVVGYGLENIQAGIDLQMKGVSARKVVVTL